MTSALIGSSGFVGTTLRKQRTFDAGFRSTNIAEINGKSFTDVICAAAPAQKWKANKDPEGDLQAIQGIMAHLDTIECNRFILISTVDVFPRPFDVNEDTPIGDHPEAYGRNRLLLERFIAGRFTDHWIVRLPALVGPGLRKNIVFDLLNHNNVSAIDSRSSFQFYPMVNLWSDLQVALRKELRLLHLAAMPITVSEVAQEGFGMTFENEVASSPASYRFQSKHADSFGAKGPYQYSKRDTLLAIRAYVQSEPRTTHTVA